MLSSEPRFLQGIAEFNRRRFFEAHEVWEDLWHFYRQNDRAMLQGLIQVAAGCHHLRTDNLNGAFSLIGKGLAKLSQYGEEHAQIDLGRLRDQCKRLLDSVAACRLGGNSVIDGPSYPTIAIVPRDCRSDSAEQ